MIRSTNSIYVVSKAALSCLLILLFSVGLACADDRKNAKSYQKNSKLTSLLDEEQFALGVSCDDAMKVFALDSQMERGKRIRLDSSTIGFGGEKEPKIGFFRANCEDNKVNELEKIVQVQEGHLDRKSVFDPFIKKYGKPSIDTEGQNNIRYYIKYNDKFVIFRVTVYAQEEKTTTIYEIEDYTSNIGK